MNKVIQYCFLLLFPFYPIWGWLAYSITKRHIDIFTFLLFIPLVIYCLLTQKIKIPKYLIFLILFTIYHISSVFINHLVPPQENLLFFILSDEKLLACLVLFAIENTRFDEKFISKMNQLILAVVIITLIVSLIQIKFNTFFIHPDISQNPQTYIYLQQHRNFSIFSWININSLGITFPILISILLSSSGINKKSFPIVLLSGIIVSFLSKARYIMISTIIVISQLFFVKKIDFRKRIYVLLLMVSLIAALIVVGNIYDLKLQEVIENRILEKGTGMESAKARLASFEIFMQVFPEHPLFGVGPQTGVDVLKMLRGVTRSIHVGYLSYLYFYGIFGALLVFISIFYLLKDSWVVAQKFQFWGSFYGFLTFCFANVTFVYFNFNEIGVILAVIYIKYYKDIMLTEASENIIPQLAPSEQ
jgi:hypothetical protein